MADISTTTTVLIAMDESDFASYALEYYMKHVHRKCHQVILLHVPEYHTIIQSRNQPWHVRYQVKGHDPGEAMVMTDVSVVINLLQEEEKRIKSFLDNLGEKLKSYGIGGKVKSVGGSAGEVICSVANEEKVGMIIVGSRGMGTIRRTLMGSVSDYIIHHAHIPVLVCKKADH